MNEGIHELEISEKFLKEINHLTKMGIKVYLSLAYLKHKRGDTFYASHKEIAINVFDDHDANSFSKWFGVMTCHKAFLKAFKQLEELHLIKIDRSKTKNGKPLTNRYKVY